MAEAKVTIKDARIIVALNTPGGAVYELRDSIGSMAKDDATANAPENDPDNARHRNSVTGLYKEAMFFDRRGSHGHHVIARVGNRMDYAYYVEFGRLPAVGRQTFSWAHWTDDPPGTINTVSATKGYDAHHVVRDAVRAALVAHGIFGAL